MYRAEDGEGGRVRVERWAAEGGGLDCAEFRRDGVDRQATPASREACPFQLETENVGSACRL
jgi:hypothetical protein